VTTSGSYVFAVTRDDLIRNAMLILGKLGEGESPTASETTDCSMFLNMMVKQWMGTQDFAPGLKMWKRKRGEMYLSSTTGQYSLGPSGDNWTNTSYSRTLTANAAAAATTLTTTITNATNGDYIGIELDSGALFWTTINGAPSGTTITITSGLPSAAASGNYVFNYTSKAQRPLQIVTAVLRDVNNDDFPISLLTLQDYEMLPSKTDTNATGDPTAIYYESQLTNGVLYTDIAASSDVTKHLHIVYLEAVQDFVNPTDNPEYPQQWYMALSWGLAKQICPMFNSPWTQEMQTNYFEALTMAREADAEVTSLFFQPGNDDGSWMPGKYGR